jgi:hypothetical protein
MVIMGQIFEQQPKESAKAFAAFSLYLNMGPERSLGKVARRLDKSVTMLGRWSVKFDWPGRVQAQAAYLATVEREAVDAGVRSKAAGWLKRQADHRDEEWRTRDEALELARAAIGRWKANEKRCGSLEGIGRLLELASKLGRLASGMATDKTEITGEDGGAIRVEFEAALKKVYGRRGEVVDVEAAPAHSPLPIADSQGGKA